MRGSALVCMRPHISMPKVWTQVECKVKAYSLSAWCLWQANQFLSCMTDYDKGGSMWSNQILIQFIPFHVIENTVWSLWRLLVHMHSTYILTNMLRLLITRQVLVRTHIQNEVFIITYVYLKLVGMMLRVKRGMYEWKTGDRWMKTMPDRMYKSSKMPIDGWTKSVNTYS